MVIAAHPDDADFGPAATAARWIDAGSEGWLVCCTSGDQGGEDPDADPLELAALRETEQRAAAAIVGYAGVTFLHAPDGALANDLALREQLVREIRTFRPDAVLATDPESSSTAAVASTTPTIGRPAWRRSTPSIPRHAIRWPSRGWRASGLAAHAVRRLYLFWSDKTRHLGGRVSDTLDRKVDALRAHASQIHDPDGWPSDPQPGGRGRSPIGVGSRRGAAAGRHRR